MTFTSDPSNADINREMKFILFQHLDSNLLIQKNIFKKFDKIKLKNVYNNETKYFNINISLIIISLIIIIIILSSMIYKIYK